MAQKTDVLICGSGSAGLSAAIWLARFGIDFKVLERRDGPLKIGQADGVQCRTVEIFESLGISEPLLREAYHVMELTFWSPGEQGGIQRNSVNPDTEPGLSHQPHVILNQARINEIMINEIKRLRGHEGDWIDYGCEAQDVKVRDNASGGEHPYPCEVQASRNGSPCVYQAKYVLGCDGAHSTIRRSLGFKMVGDSSDAVWGVMDIYPHTDFPDIRKKTVINSTAGNIIIIPREGDSLVRFYIELPGKAASEVDLKYLQERASLVFRPYRVDVAETAWWSAYSIGQRQADHFTKDFRVFLTGDACHTHSPKAGQGMNVSLQDGYNIGWKLGHVLTGRSSPQLLETYVSERQKTAAELIEFDRYFTKLFSTSYREENGITTKHFQEQFVKAGRYTAGFATQYSASAITRAGDNDGKLASKLDIGARLPSHPVVRLCDAHPMQLINTVPSDGRWHIVVFASGSFGSDTWTKMAQTADSLEPIIRSYTPENEDIDSVINSILVLHSSRPRIEPNQLPGLFQPKVGKLKMRSLVKAFVDDPDDSNAGHGQLFKSFGIEASQGAVVIVRPDQYVSQVSPLGDTAAIRTFFDGCLARV